MSSPCLCGFPLGSIVFFTSQKHADGYAKTTLGVNYCVHDALSCVVLEKMINMNTDGKCLNFTLEKPHKPNIVAD